MSGIEDAGTADGGDVTDGGGTVVDQTGSPSFFGFFSTPPTGSSSGGTSVWDSLGKIFGGIGATATAFRGTPTIPINPATGLPYTVAGPFDSMMPILLIGGVGVLAVVLLKKKS